MKHDIDHEEKQNAAIRQLCHAVASAAAAAGCVSAVREAHAAALLLEDAPAVVDSPDAEVQPAAPAPAAPVSAPVSAHAAPASRSGSRFSGKGDS